MGAATTWRLCTRRASVLTSISGVGPSLGSVAPAAEWLADGCRGSGRLLQEVGVEGCDAVGGAGVYLPAEVAGDDLVFVGGDAVEGKRTFRIEPPPLLSIGPAKARIMASVP